MESDTESALIESFKKNTSNIFESKGAYPRVQALLLTWSENDLNPEKEVAALYKLFETHFHYEVEPYRIPTEERAVDALIDKIRAVGKQATQGTLLIVYYAGHCHKDDHGHARWAAKANGGPTLSWHVIQQLLFLVEGDVLLLLDCCNASLIAKGTKDTGKFEMIAACGKNSKTVAPSNESFTRILIHELKPCAERGIYADHLASKIRENSKFGETPVFHDFVQKSPAKILLQRSAEQLPAGFGKKPSSYIVFLASLSDDVPGQKIAEWLKVGAPQQVIGVDIEALILRARRLQGMEDSHVFAPGSFLGKLSKAAQTEVTQALRGLHTTMDHAYQGALETQAHQPNMTAQQSVKDIQKSVTALCESIETPILQDLSAVDQQVAISDPFVGNTRALESIGLREAVTHGSERVGVEISRARILKVIDSGDSVRKLGQIEGGYVIFETFSYAANPNNGTPYSTTIKQVRHISGLLSAVSLQNFHILPFRGFFQDTVSREFGLVFDAVPSFAPKSKLVSLRSLYKEQKVVPLGHRFCLLYALCDAIDYFHRVGWVHKGIRSTNIVFHRNTDEEDSGNPHIEEDAAKNAKKQGELGIAARIGPFDLAQPYLFGFEYARADDQGTNLNADYTEQNNMYRHPDRWDRPLVKYTKAHDIYALGIVMLEIALWKDIRSIIKIESGQIITASQVFHKVKKTLRAEVGHRVGDVLAQAIEICLEFDKSTQGLSEYESQLHFQHGVKSRIGQVIGKI